MDTSQMQLIILFSVTCGVLCLWNFRKNKELRNAHRSKIGDLENEMEVHISQIGFRKKHLNRYDFQKYNLSEALVVQPKIILSEKICL